MNAEFILETPRLFLRPFIPEDASSLYLLNADPSVLRYTGDGPFADIGEADSFIRHYDHYSQFGYGRWAVLGRESLDFLGWCGLRYAPENEETDIGFRFHRKYWGKGFATEAAKECLNYGFVSLGIPRIIGRAQIQNIASHKVLEKIGMQQLGSMYENAEQWILYEKFK